MTKPEEPQGEHNRLIPNSFQTPNVLIDRLMPLLLNDELRVVMFATRHIYGWSENLATRSAPLSLTAFEHGHRGSAGCGLKRPAIHAAIRTLEALGVLRRIGEATAKGQRWALAERDTDIHWDEMEARQVEIADANRRRTAKAVRTSAQQRSPGTSHIPLVRPTYQGDGMSDVPASRYVPHTSGMPDIPPAGMPDVPAAGMSHIPIETQYLKPIDDDEVQDSPIRDHHHQAPPPSPPTPDELTTLAPELRGLGLSSTVRSRLLEQGAERALALVLHAKSAGRNPAGLLVRMLEAGDDPADRYVEQSRAMLRTPDLDRQADAERRVESRANGQRPAVAPPPQPHPSLDERPGPHGMTVREVWHAALSQLALQLNQATFENYLKGAVVDRYADGVLWVRPPNPMTGIRMGQLIHVIEGVVSQIAGAPVTVRVASEEAA